MAELDLYETGPKSEKIVDNDTFFSYIPENVSDNTGVVIFYPGAGGYNHDDIAFREYALNNSDKIIIISKSAIENTEDITSKLQNIRVNYNVTLGDVDVLGHSFGDEAAFNTASKLNNNGFHVSNVVVLDSKDNLSHLKISEQEADTLKKSNTNVYIINQYQKAANGHYDENGNWYEPNTIYLQSLINAGVPLWFINPLSKDEDFFDNHSQIKKEFVRNGLLDLLHGDVKSLGDDRWFYKYLFSYYDYENNQWVDDVPEEEFNKYFFELFKLLSNKYSKLMNLEDLNINSITSTLGYSGEMTSSTEYAANEMNTIRHAIGKTNFIGTLKNVTSNSNMAIIQLENEILSQYYGITGSMLEKLANETEAIVSIALAVEKFDRNLEKYACELNSGINTVQEISQLQKTDISHKSNSVKQNTSNFKSDNIEILK